MSNQKYSPGNSTSGNQRGEGATGGQDESSKERRRYLIDSSRELCQGKTIGL